MWLRRDNDSHFRPDHSQQLDPYGEPKSFFPYAQTEAFHYRGYFLLACYAGRSKQCSIL